VAEVMTKARMEALRTHAANGRFMDPSANKAILELCAALDASQVSAMRIVKMTGCGMENAHSALEALYARSEATHRHLLETKPKSAPAYERHVLGRIGQACASFRRTRQGVTKELGNMEVWCPDSGTRVLASSLFGAPAQNHVKAEVSV
jgi:hypothetical protein